MLNTTDTIYLSSMHTIHRYIYAIVLCCLLLTNQVTYASDNNELDALKKTDDPKAFLEHYHALIDPYFSHKQFDTIIVYLNILDKLPILQNNADVYSLLLMDRAYALEETGKPADSTFIQAIHCARISGVDSLIADHNLDRGRYLYRIHNFDSSVVVLKRALSAYNALADSLQQIKTLSYLGMLHDHAGLYIGAQEYYLKALEMAQLLQDTLYVAGTYNNLAIIFKKQGDFKAAESYYLKTKDIWLSQNDSIGIASVNTNLGLLQKDLGNLDKAYELLMNSYHYFAQRDSVIAYNYFNTSMLLHNLGVIHMEMQNMDSARYYFNRSLAQTEQNNMKKSTVANHVFLGKVFLQTNQFSKALWHANKVSELTSHQTLEEEQLDGEELLYQIYKKMGNSEQALHHYEKYNYLKDSLLNEDVQKTLNNLRTKYEVNQKDLKIASLEKETELKDRLVLAEKNNNHILITSLAILIALVILLYIAYSKRLLLSRKLVQQTKLLEEQKEEISAAQESLVQKNALLENINRDKDEIIGVVAHDLRSPLNQIKGLLNIINSQVTNVTTQEMIQMSLKSTDILRNRINRMLDVEALNAGKVDVKMEYIKPKQLIQELISNYTESATNKNIQLIDELNAGEDLLEADKNYLLQVLENLLSNAIKYSPHGRKIWLKTDKNPEKFIFTIKDEGPGISKEEQRRLFQKFAKLKSRPTGNEDSTGLGLSIVKKYVEAMGGEVWCESNEGEGAAFFVAIKSSY